MAKSVVGDHLFKSVYKEITAFAKNIKRVDYLPNSFSVDEEEPNKLIKRFYIYHMLTMVNMTHIITRNKTPKESHLL